MSYESFIGLRYLMAKRQKSVLSIITIISIVGVALGVTALIVVLSVMGGFKKDLMQKILGTKAHIVVKHVDESPIKNSVKLANSLINKPNIVGASPFIELEAMISSPTNLSGIVLRGIDVDHVIRVTKLDDDMKEGSLENLIHPQKFLDELAKKHNDNLTELRKKLRGASTDKKNTSAKKENATTTVSPPPKTMPEHPTANTDNGTDTPHNLNDPDSLDDFIADIPDDTSMPAIDAEVVVAQPSENTAKSSKETTLPTVILGAELARNLKVELGDEVNIVTPNGGMGPSGPIPKSRPFIVVGIFYTGMYEFDSNYAYTSLPNAKDFVGIDGADGLELKIKRVEDSSKIASQLRKDLGPTYRVMDWEELNKSLFFALRIEKLAMFIVLTFIILVASFSIVAMLIMIVIEKGREIAILKSMGVSNAGVMRIFVFQGSLIGFLGSFIGTVSGLGICLFLQFVGIGLDSEVYYINTLPVEINPVEVIVVVVSALGISILATLYPAYQASILAPVQGLRYD